MSQTYSKDSFDRFGDDLCEELLSFMAFKERFRFECVSKQWQRLIFNTQLVLKIDKKLNNNLDIIEKILLKCVNITRVYYCHGLDREDNSNDKYFGLISNNSIIDLLTKHCNHLTDICLEVTDNSVPFIDPLVTKFAKQLKTLSFHVYRGVRSHVKNKWLEMCVNLTQIYTPFNNLPKTRLVLSGENGLHYKRLNNIHFISECSESRCATLFIPDLNQYFECNEVFAYNYGHNIKCIEYRLDRRLDDHLVKRLSDGLSRFPALISIKILFIMDANMRRFLSLIGPNCPKLKSLDIYCGDSVFSSQVLLAINENFKQLKRLEISATFQNQLITSTDSLHSLKQLTHLRLYYAYFRCKEMMISDNFFTIIDNNLPKLRDLRVNRVMITDNVLYAVSRLTQIRCIHLMGTNNTTEEAVNELVSKCPKSSLRLEDMVSN